MTDTVNVPTPYMVEQCRKLLQPLAGNDWPKVARQAYALMLAAAPKAEPVHDSDCALHNEPAYPNGPCDCAIKPVETLDEDDMKRARELRRDPDSEDNERFSSWFGDTLLDVHEAYVKLIAQPEAPKVEQEHVGWDKKYRPLEKGEIILDPDEVQHDDGSWHPSACGGQEAPDPSYTSHRIYRRLKHPAPASDELLDALAPFARYYDLNDCHERRPDDALEVPIYDLARASSVIAKHKGPQS